MHASRLWRHLVDSRKNDDLQSTRDKTLDLAINVAKTSVQGAFRHIVTPNAVLKKHPVF